VVSSYRLLSVFALYPALYQGTTSVVPPMTKMTRALAPANLLLAEKNMQG
jgi:uncharacterized membrane protein